MGKHNPLFQFQKLQILSTFFIILYQYFLFNLLKNQTSTSSSKFFWCFFSSNSALKTSDENLTKTLREEHKKTAFFLNSNIDYCITYLVKQKSSNYNSSSSRKIKKQQQQNDNIPFLSNLTSCKIKKLTEKEDSANKIWHFKIFSLLLLSTLPLTTFLFLSFVAYTNQKKMEKINCCK